MSIQQIESRSTYGGRVTLVTCDVQRDATGAIQKIRFISAKDPDSGAPVDYPEAYAVQPLAMILADQREQFARR